MQADPEYLKKSFPPPPPLGVPVQQRSELPGPPTADQIQTPSRTAGAPTEPAQARTGISEQGTFMSLQGKEDDEDLEGQGGAPKRKAPSAVASSSSM